MSRRFLRTPNIDVSMDKPHPRFLASILCKKVRLIHGCLRYQAKMFAKLKATGNTFVTSGDGRHDSMGHSAKFGAYTIFCCTLPLVIHFALVQVLFFFYNSYYVCFFFI